MLQRLWRVGSKRRCASTRFRASTGAVRQPTMHSSDCCARCDEERKRGRVPGWEISLDVGRSATGPCSGHEVRHAALPGHGPSGGSEPSGMDRPCENFRLRLQGSRTHQPTGLPRQMCEKLWTLLQGRAFASPRRRFALSERLGGVRARPRHSATIKVGPRR